MNHAPTHKVRTRPWNGQHIHLFEVLTEVERRILDRHTHLVEVRRRKHLYVPGDPCDQLFVVKSGVVKLSVVSPEGREIILSFLHAGDVCGELAVVGAGPHDHTAEAYEDIVVHALNADVLHKLMEESPSLACEMTRLMGLRLKTYRNRVEELLYKSAHARVAHTLLDLAGCHGVADAQGVVIPLRLSQRDIANLVGLTRETVNFILKDLRKRHLIETQGRRIRVRAPEVLHGLR